MNQISSFWLQEVVYIILILGNLLRQLNLCNLFQRMHSLWLLCSIYKRGWELLTMFFRTSIPLLIFFCFFFQLLKEVHLSFHCNCWFDYYHWLGLILLWVFWGSANSYVPFWDWDFLLLVWLFYQSVKFLFISSITS